MKFNFLTILAVVASIFLASCEYDNFDAPEFTLSGKVVYEGKTLGVRSNGTRLQLWQSGYPLRSAIDVFINQDGYFSAKLFPGHYKVTRLGNSPWLQQATDSVALNITGDMQFDMPVTPYMTITNETIQKVGTTISAQLTVNRVVPTANLEVVRLYLSKLILVDDLRNDGVTSANVANIVLGSPTTLTANIPDNMKNLDYVYARVGVKSSSSGEYTYSKVQRIALK